jgi:hypothetical protein
MGSSVKPSSPVGRGTKSIRKKKWNIRKAWNESYPLEGVWRQVSLHMKHKIGWVWIIMIFIWGQELNSRLWLGAIIFKSRVIEIELTRGRRGWYLYTRFSTNNLQQSPCTHAQWSHDKLVVPVHPTHFNSSCRRLQREIAKWKVPP